MVYYNTSGLEQRSHRMIGPNVLELLQRFSIGNKKTNPPPPIFFFFLKKIKKILKIKKKKFVEGRIHVLKMNLSEYKYPNICLF